GSCRRFLPVPVFLFPRLMGAFFRLLSLVPFVVGLLLLIGLISWDLRINWVKHVGLPKGVSDREGLSLSVWWSVGMLGVRIARMLRNRHRAIFPPNNAGGLDVRVQVNLRGKTDNDITV